MKLVLLSGGSGKRLWPLSNDSRSKQFLKVLVNPENEMESMVQRVWRQLGAAGLSESAYVATSKAQVEMIQSQLGSAPIIVEPERRDTFPAIALAATYLYSIVGVSLNEVVTILPVDPYVDEAFFNKINELEQLVLSTNADLALMGVTPTYPSEKYGYIVPKNGSEAKVGATDYHVVDRFTEKPDEETAKTLIENSALWNCGVFAFKLDYMINHLINKGYPIQYEEMVKQYDKMTKISFDYEIVEKAEKLVVTAYDGYWKDLGTWNTLTEQMDTDQIGKGLISPCSTNTHLVNELDIPVVVLGLDNVVVATSPDGILVTEKNASPKIKDMLKNMEQRPMYEERRWGSYRVLDYKKFAEGQEILTKRMCIQAGKNISYQLHLKRSEVWTIVSGEGEFILDENYRKVKAGDVLVIPVGGRHAIRAITDLEYIEVQRGSELVEEDNIRLYLEWSEIMEQSKPV
ncbi:mannose-1-phosphate guanylyltransferase [Paenibacillus mucilaginosus]|uniref:sugar phosphate nucleotidyltransferase n=1 Tax=Paenibacillus mucilaginosus TaxID=61624 RepID=UPI003D2196DD